MLNARGRRLVIILLLCGMVGLCFFPWAHLMENFGSGGAGLRPTPEFQTATDPLIIITSDAGIAAYASRGNGSAAAPYIIENKVIDGEGSNYCINISHTSAHLIVRNCTVYNGYCGVHLSDVENTQLINLTVLHNAHGIYVQEYYSGRIVNCSVKDILGIGIAMEIAADIQLLNNTIFNATRGMDLFEANNITIAQSRISNSSNYGIQLWYSQKCTVIGNNFSGAYPWALEAIGCNNLTLRENTVRNGAGGFILQQANSTKVVNNTVSNILGGIACNMISASIIVNNTVCNNMGYGIFLFQASNSNLITGNTLRENQLGIKVNDRYGSYLPCVGNTIQGNDLQDRVPAPFPSFLRNETLSEQERATAYLWWNYQDGATVFYIYRMNGSTLSIEGQTPVGKVIDDGVTLMYYWHENLTQSGTYYYLIVLGNPWGNSTASYMAKFEVQIWGTPDTSIPSFELPLLLAVILSLLYRRIRVMKKSTIYDKYIEKHAHFFGGSPSFT